MDYEQKYKELVNAVKILKETNLSDEGIQNWVNENVPELRESEDEKIRKDLIGFFKDDDAYLCHNKEDIIAWLEKQGEKPINNTDEDIVEAVKDTSILDMVESLKRRIGG